MTACLLTDFRFEILHLKSQISNFEQPMSRRTKLLVTAVFLMLLAVPVAYIFLTWHPENPLRFEVVEHAPGMETEVDTESAYTTIYVKITNTSSSTIHTYSDFVLNDRPPPGENPYRGMIEFETHADGRPRVYLGEGFQFPPECVCYATCLIHPDEVHLWRSRGYTDFTVVYSWCSSPRVYALQACTWLRSRLPESFRSIIPEIETEQQRTPLEFVGAAAPPSRRLSIEP